MMNLDQPDSITFLARKLAVAELGWQPLIISAAFTTVRQDTVYNDCQQQSPLRRRATLSASAVQVWRVITLQAFATPFPSSQFLVTKDHHRTVARPQCSSESSVTHRAFLHKTVSFFPIVQIFFDGEDNVVQPRRRHLSLMQPRTKLRTAGARPILNPKPSTRVHRIFLLLGRPLRDFRRLKGARRANRRRLRQEAAHFPRQYSFDAGEAETPNTNVLSEAADVVG
jgi:hypothetical protein